MLTGEVGQVVMVGEVVIPNPSRETKIDRSAKRGEHRPGSTPSTPITPSMQARTERLTRGERALEEAGARRAPACTCVVAELATLGGCTCPASHAEDIEGEDGGTWSVLHTRPAPPDLGASLARETYPRRVSPVFRGSS